MARNFDSVLKCKIKGHLPAVVDYHKLSNLGQYSFVIIVKPLKKTSKAYIKNLYENIFKEMKATFLILKFGGCFSGKNKIT